MEREKRSFTKGTTDQATELAFVSGHRQVTISIDMRFAISRMLFARVIFIRISFMRMSYALFFLDPLALWNTMPEGRRVPNKNIVLRSTD